MTRVLHALDSSQAARMGALGVILLVALALRLYGINWDNGFFFHPDERFIILLKLPEIGSLAGFDLQKALDPATSPWNPRWFAYGSFPFYVLKGMQDVATALNPAFKLDEMRYLGRGLSALADIGTIAATYWLGARLYGWRAGMLAALFLALAVLHIQLSHFATFDIQLTLWVMVTLAGCALAMQQPGRLASLVAGAGLGLALATKISVLGLVAPIAAAHLLYLLTQIDGTLAPRTTRARLVRAIAGLAITGTVSAVVLVVAQPYMLLDSAGFLRDTREQTEMSLRIRDLPFTRQYIDTPAYWYQINQLSAWGFGWPLGLVAWLGLLFSFIRAGFARHRGDLLLLSWIVPYFFITGAFPVKFMRYMLPLTPLLLLLGARLLVAWHARSAPRAAAPLLQGGAAPPAAPRRALSLPAAAIVAVVALTGWYALAFSTMYGEPHTAVRMSEWLRANVAPGTPMAREHWEEGLPKLEAYPQKELPLYEPDNQAKVDNLAQVLSSSRVVLFYSDRLYGTIPRLPERYPMSTEYYRMLFSGELGYELLHAEATYPSLLGMSWAHDTLIRPELPAPAGLPLGSGLQQRGHADESFSAYDHPLVLAFQNTGNLPAATIRTKLSGYLPATPLGQKPEGLVYPPEDRQAQEAGGTWSELFNRDSLSNRMPVVVWMLAFELLALLALPACLWLFRRFPDRGAGVAPMLGWVVTGWLVWLAASLHWLPFGPGSVVLVFVLLAVASALAVRARQAQVAATLRAHWRPMLLSHGVFLVAFGAFVLVRMNNPDLWHPARGGEKPMDFAYLNAIIRSTSMPPYDPWYAGGYLNYYYFGQFLVAMLIKVTGIVPAVAYNLAVPLLFACAAGGAFSVGGALVARAGRRRATAGAAAAHETAIDRQGDGAPPWRWWWAGGLCTAIAVTVAGNLDGAAQLLERLRQAGGAQLKSFIPGAAGAAEALFGVVQVVTGGARLPALDYWRSRGMGDMDRTFLDPGSSNPSPTIVEFPYFTFLFADLHAHLIALPIALLALALALRMVLGGGSDGWRGRLFSLSLSGLVLGALRWTNSWDYPAYLLVTMAAVLVAELWGRNLTLGVLLRTGVQCGVLLAASIVPFQPFQQHYELFYGGGVLPTPERTTPELYLRIHGLFLAAICSLVVYQGWRRLNEGGLLRALAVIAFSRNIHRTAQRVGRLAPAAGNLLLGMGVAAVLVVVLAFVLAAVAGPTGAGIALLIGAVVALGMAELQERREGPAYALALAIAAMGLGLTLAVEVVKLDIPGEVQRMNNVFKLYLQVWVFFAVAGAFAFWWVAARVLGGGWPRAWAPRLWTGAMGMLALGALVYPLMATPVRINDRFARTDPTLDGARFMATAVYNDQTGPVELKWDDEALRWMQDNVQGSPVVLEAQTPLYRWGGRVSVHTGLPSVLGWDWHQSQQRWDYRPYIERRKNDVNRIYSMPDAVAAQRLLLQYGVKYVYLGQLERGYYPAEGVNKFPAMANAGMLREVYRNQRVTLYEVAG